MTREEFEQERTSLELEILKQELELKQLDAGTKRQQFDRKRWPIAAAGAVTIIVAIIGLTGTLVTHFLQQRAALNLEQKKFEYSLYQQAQNAKDLLAAAELLDFFIRAGLLHGEEGQFVGYLDAGEPERVPVIISSTLPPPDIPAVGTLRIVDHFLAGEGLRYDPSPNYSGDLKDPKIVIVHSTSSTDIDRTVSWLSRSDSRASYHLVIDRDGRISQLIPFSRIAWHAGVSQWEGFTGLNRYSIGIAFVNAGRLTERAPGEYVSWTNERIPESEVVPATHKHQSQPAFWHTYTEAQIEKFREVIELLRQMYGIEHVIGNDDASPGRKVDPGPTFPIAELTVAVP